MTPISETLALLELTFPLSEKLDSTSLLVHGQLSASAEMLKELKGHSAPHTIDMGLLTDLLSQQRSLNQAQAYYQEGRLDDAIKTLFEEITLNVLKERKKELLSSIIQAYHANNEIEKATFLESLL